MNHLESMHQPLYISGIAGDVQKPGIPLVPKHRSANGISVIHAYTCTVLVYSGLFPHSMNSRIVLLCFCHRDPNAVLKALAATVDVVSSYY